MKLRPEFKNVLAGLLNRSPVISLDVCLGELLREEQRLATQLVLAQESVPIEMVNVAYSTQNRGRMQSQIQCHRCRDFDHILNNCTKKFSNYCKKEGHIIQIVVPDHNIDKARLKLTRLGVLFFCSIKHSSCIHSTCYCSCYFRNGSTNDHLCIFCSRSSE
jgi:hypothetical protein